MWAFKGYGFRWKIEEYHRHVKQEYNLEDIQIKTFTGLHSIPGIAIHSNAHDIQENTVPAPGLIARFWLQLCEDCYRYLYDLLVNAKKDFRLNGKPGDGAEYLKRVHHW